MKKIVVILFAMCLVCSSVAFAEDFGIGDFNANDTGSSVAISQDKIPCNAIEIYVEHMPFPAGTFTFSEEWKDYTAYDESSAVKVSMPESCNSIEIFID